MRIKVVFGENGGKRLKVERDYRRYFMSFLKNAFARSGIFSELYSGKKVKPFSFSVYLGEEVGSDEEGKSESIVLTPPLKLVFSTGDPVIFAGFYNGVLQLKREKNGLKLPGGYNLPVEDINIEGNVKIRSSCVIFKTTGICVLTDPSQSARDFEKWFIVPEEKNMDRFNEVLQKRMIEKYERIKGKKFETKIIFTPLSKEMVFPLIRKGILNPSFADSPVKKVYVKHYKGFLKGFKGVFILESHPEMLQFIYDYGLGVRTGQGFGLLELIAQI